MIEVKYDNFPADTAWTPTLLECAVTLVAGQATDSFSTNCSAVLKTAL
jgi:hypothetical protein